MTRHFVITKDTAECVLKSPTEVLFSYPPAVRICDAADVLGIPREYIELDLIPEGVFSVYTENKNRFIPLAEVARYRKERMTTLEGII